MEINLGIIARNDNEETDFSESKIQHANCKQTINPEMVIKRNPATNVYSLVCNCGLSIEFEQSGKAESTIIRCAIDQLEHELPNGSYISNFEGPVVISKWKKGNA